MSIADAVSSLKIGCFLLNWLPSGAPKLTGVIVSDINIVARPIFNNRIARDFTGYSIVLRVINIRVTTTSLAKISTILTVGYYIYPRLRRIWPIDNIFASVFRKFAVFDFVSLLLSYNNIS